MFNEVIYVIVIYDYNMAKFMSGTLFSLYELYPV